MTAVVVSHAEVESLEWHATRAAGVGGSDIAAILGLSKYDSPRSLYMRKLGQLPEPEENREMTWGKLLEPVLADRWRRTVGTGATPDTGIYLGTGVGMWADQDAPWRIANPDGLIYPYQDLAARRPPAPTALWECKTARTAEGWGRDDGDPESVPVAYRCQVQWYMDILALPCAWITVLIGGSDERHYRISYDPTDAAFIRERAEEFWRRVKAGDPPPADGHDATTDALKHLHPDLEDREAEIPTDLASDYAYAVARVRQAKEQKAAAENRIREAAGSARYVHCGGRKVATRVISEVPEHTRKASTRDYYRAADDREDSE